MEKVVPSKAAIEEAKKNPNGYVYAIDEAFNSINEDVPPTAILGAWKVNEHGEIVGDFVKNPNYVDLKNYKNSNS